MKTILEMTEKELGEMVDRNKKFYKKLCMEHSREIKDAIINAYKNAIAEPNCRCKTFIKQDGTVYTSYNQFGHCWQQLPFTDELPEEYQLNVFDFRYSDEEYPIEYPTEINDFVEYIDTYYECLMKYLFFECGD